jgi:hypothetical protein
LEVPVPNKKWTIALLLFAIPALTGIWLALSVSAQEVVPPAKIKILSIPACAFNEISWSDDWNTHRTGAQIYSVPQGPSVPDFGKYYAPVILPQNAIIREVRLYCKADDPPGMTINLVRSELSDGVITDTTLATITTTTLSSQWRMLSTTTVSPKKIDNADACYFIYLYLSDVEAMDVILHHVEIRYSGKW